MSVNYYIDKINDTTKKLNEKLNEISSSIDINSNINFILEFSKLQDNIASSIRNFERNQINYNHSNANSSSTNLPNWNVSFSDGWGSNIY